MESIDKIELTDKSVYPDEAILEGVLGEVYPSYCALLELFARNGMNYEWRYYMDGKAWLCKVQKKKKTIVWMSAWRGLIKAAIYIHEKHLDRLFEVPVSEATRESIRSARKVGKLKPCIFEVRNQEILKDLDQVMQFKIQNK
jgi:hypothetical protein